MAFTPEDGIIPVRLTSFKATAVASGIQLLWATSQEINTKQFEIEKSTDGIHFTGISKVASSGNSSIVHNYNLIDTKPVNGLNYYRLKTVDISGNFSYSNIVKINYGLKNISIFPNPAIDMVTVQHPVSTNAIIVITDMQGRRINTQNINPANTSDNISVKNLSKGQYMVKYIDNGLTNVTILNKQ